MASNKKQDYDKYIESRASGRWKVLLIKIFLYLNTAWNFHQGLRNRIYKLLGVNLAKDDSEIYIAREVLIDDNFPELVTIEEGVAIGWRVMLLCHDALNETKKIVAPIHIKKKAVIGAGTIVLPGVTIGEYAIVGAGAIVRKDVPDYGVLIGPQSTGNW